MFPKTPIFCFLLCGLAAHADYFYDKYTDQPKALLLIAVAAQKDPTFKSRTDGKTAIYLKKLEYIGPITAPFGTVHVATLFYIHSSPIGSKIPPLGEHYIVFLDKDFKIGGYWKFDELNESFEVQGSKFISDGTVVFDYSHMPPNDEVLFDGKVLGIPIWEK